MKLVISSNKPEFAMRMLLQAIDDFPEMKFGWSKGIGMKWTGQKSGDTYHFWAHRTKTSWVITQTKGRQKV